MTSSGSYGGNGYPPTVCAGVVCEDHSINYDPYCKQPGDVCSAWACVPDLSCGPEACAAIGGYCRECGDGYADVCVPRCPEQPCVIGESCLEDGSCGPTPCTTSAECPANHECGASSTCTRRTCSADSDCAGPCFEGVCYEELPHCSTCY